jgi:hypothetical protein
MMVSTEPILSKLYKHISINCLARKAKFYENLLKRHIILDIIN